MFGIACSSDEFSDADVITFLGLQSVGCSKLTQTLFLINPRAYLPIDDKLYLTEEDTYKTSLELMTAMKKTGYSPYRQAMDEIRRHYPGCDFWEINLFNYLKNSGEFIQSRNYFQIGSNIYGGSKSEDTDYIKDFYELNGVWVGNSSSGKKHYPIKEPSFGDIILSHINHTGNGIGIVLHNEYAGKNGFDSDSVIKVLWIAREERERCLNTKQMSGMSHAHAIKETFLISFRNHARC